MKWSWTPQENTTSREQQSGPLGKKEHTGNQQKRGWMIQREQQWVKLDVGEAKAKVT